MTYKPYGQYIDTEIEWIGLIPSSWKLLKSKFIFNRVNNQSTTGNEELLSVSEYYGVKPKKETINEGDFLSRSDSLVGYKKCSKNDLVMNIMLAWKKGLGVTNYDGIVSPAYEIFNINLLLTFPIYMNYLLRTDLYASEFKRHSYGVIDSRLRLYPDNFKEIECILPPLEEQKQIANYLDQKTAKINATIAKNEELLDLLEEKRVALINQVVTKGLDPDVPMKDSGVEWIGEIPEHWNTNKLKFLLDKLTDGAHSSVEIIDEGYPYVTVADLDEVNEYVDIDNCKRISKEDYDFLVRNGCKPAIGDILFSQIGTIGLVVPVDNFDDFVLLSSVAILTLSRNINRRWVIYFLKSLVIKNQWRQLLAGGAVKRITLQHISNFITIVPPLVEQKEISKYLDIEVSKINKTISKIQENITLLEEYKTSLIHHVVTGKLDVRGEEI